jgi:sugar O-acyltransferase (sialic acid O-acetyltransferase NeuD family)
MVTILGMSEATLTMIMDNFESCKVFTPIKVINNLDIVTTKPYLVDGFVITQEPELSGDEQYFFLGGTQVQTKLKLVETFNPDIEKVINIAHGTAQVSSTVTLNKGIMLNSLVSIAAYAKLGNYVTINRNSSVGHHTIIGDFCTIGPGSHIAGNITIGNNTTIGMGSIIRDGITIGENCIIGMGSVIVKDVPANSKIIQKK